MSEPLKIVVIIPTMGRESIGKSIHSVFNQSRLPDEFIVVYDDLRPSEIDGRVKVVQNTRTKNLSGAVNTAVYKALRDGYSPESTFIAILDDDDTWESNYLSSCEKTAYEGYNWIISGIIRHDSDHPEGMALPIPENINPRAFLTTNPGVQGSNLFVRLDILLRAGNFDEMMVSTTDRDTCYRIATLPHVRPGIVREHLVHHMAIGDDRLSNKDNPRKRKGLEYFYHKYGSQMTEAERKAFSDRARDLFNVKIPPEKAPRVERKPKSGSEKLNRPIVVGILCSRTSSAEILVNDLVRVKNEGLPIERVVILLTRGAKWNKPEPIGIKIETIREEDVQLPSYFMQDSDSHEGIASSRQRLHYLLHQRTLDIPGVIAWILDDDVRIGYLGQDGQFKEITAKEIAYGVNESIQNGLDIAIGMITGDPPIPPLAMVRVSLIDQYYKSLGNEVMNFMDLSDRPDYYYDYSESHSDHLECPVNGPSAPLEGIVRGYAITRPVRYNEGNSKVGNILARGGNTFVLNRDSLDMPFNTSPVIKGRLSRRGDTIWSLMGKYRFGYKIGQVGIPVFHHRDEENTSISRENMLSDIVGRATVRALVSGFEGWNHDMKSVFEEKAREYLLMYRVNAYRVNALIEMMMASDRVSDQNKQTLRTIQPFFSQETLGWLQERIDSITQEEIDGFFLQLFPVSPAEALA